MPLFLNNIIYDVHDSKFHGINPDTIPDNVKLIIAPDSSSNNFLEHEYLKKYKDIDILVIDHHQAEKISNYACVINNQLCDYKNKSLSGVGMVYKFCSYIDKILKINYSNDLLDLVALGMIADMMDLKFFETHYLIKKGLNKINNPYFKMMCKKNSYSLKDKITPIGVAFYIAPYINATIRSGSYEQKLLLFESMLDFKANKSIKSTKRGHKEEDLETIVEQACRNSVNIKNKQTKERDQGLKILEEIIEKEDLLKNKILIIKILPEYNISKNLTGLIANQLMSKY